MGSTEFHSLLNSTMMQKMLNKVLGARTRNLVLGAILMLMCVQTAKAKPCRATPGYPGCTGKAQRTYTGQEWAECCNVCWEGHQTRLAWIKLNPNKEYRVPVPDTANVEP